jgi:hypothetical protein
LILPSSPNQLLLLATAWEKQIFFYSSNLHFKMLKAPARKYSDDRRNKRTIDLHINCPVEGSYKNHMIIFSMTSIRGAILLPLLVFTSVFYPQYKTTVV